MSMDTSGLPFAKSRPRALDQADRKQRIVTTDKAQDVLVKRRSKGQCEVFIVGQGRCPKKAMSIHHQLSGWGVRARGRSALAEHKQHVCDGPTGCHRLITGHVLRLLADGDLPKYSDAYERVK